MHHELLGSDPFGVRPPVKGRSFTRVADWSREELVVWDEAENRLHAQKALLALVIR